MVLADLSGGSPAARLLGASEPGVHEVSAEGTSLTVAVPERFDIVPVGSHQTARAVLAAPAGEQGGRGGVRIG